MKISKPLVVCLTVGFLGLLAFALGLAAEIKRIKVSDVTFTSYHECTHPRSVAFALGLTASLSLIIAHVIIHEETFMVFLVNTSIHNDLIFYWSTLILAVLLLLAGTSLNDYKSSKGSTIVGAKCYLVKPVVFIGSAVVSLVNVTTGIIFYLMIVSAIKKMEGDNGGATGYPNPGKGIQLA
ncbi:hypothetical protein C5167_032662 [Papaver somniferum]|uniref:Uncharacterized protein n=1 Tax=Papaver somniferum TaxID=3469 RepID=A0A4Y7KAZ8_PAPSO|nr:hypothetical protein C5167_032662 [Papaver somniferum]